MTNLYPLDAVKSFMGPPIASIQKACNDIRHLCSTALGTLNSGGGRLGGSGGGGGSGRQNSKLDQLIAYVEQAVRGIDRIDTHMERFANIDLPLQAKFVRNMYGAHQATIAYARNNPPVMPHENVCKLIRLLFMCTRQRVRPPQLQNVPDSSFNGLEFCNIGTAPGGDRADCNFKNYDAAVGVYFSPRTAQQPQNILQTLYSATLSRYEMLRMLVPVLEQLWKLSKTNTDRSFEQHTKDHLQRAGAVGGKRKSITIGNMPSDKTIGRWKVLASIMSLLGFGKNLAGAMGDMSPAFGKFFADAFVFAVIEGDQRPPRVATHEEADLQPIFCRRKLLEAVAGLAGDGADTLPQAQIIALWNTSGHSTSNILHALAEEAATTRPKNVRWRLHFLLEAGLVGCVPVHATTCLPIETTATSEKAFLLWGVAPPPVGHMMRNLSVLLPEHVLPRFVCSTGKGPGNSFGDMLIISKESRVAVPLVWYIMTLGCTYSDVLNRVVMEIHSGGTGGRKKRVLRSIKRSCIKDDPLLVETLAAVECGFDRTGGEDALSRGMHIEKLREDFFEKHEFAIPQPHTYAPRTIPWRHWSEQVKTLSLSNSLSRDPISRRPCKHSFGEKWRES